MAGRGASHRPACVSAEVFNERSTRRRSLCPSQIHCEDAPPFVPGSHGLVGLEVPGGGQYLLICLFCALRGRRSGTGLAVARGRRRQRAHAWSDAGTPTGSFRSRHLPAAAGRRRFPLQRGPIPRPPVRWPRPARSRPPPAPASPRSRRCRWLRARRASRAGRARRAGGRRLQGRRAAEAESAPQAARTSRSTGQIFLANSSLRAS